MPSFGRGLVRAVSRLMLVTGMQGLDVTHGPHGGEDGAPAGKSGKVAPGFPPGPGAAAAPSLFSPSYNTTRTDTCPQSSRSEPHGPSNPAYTPFGAQGTRGVVDRVAPALTSVNGRMDGAPTVITAQSNAVASTTCDAAATLRSTRRLHAVLSSHPEADDLVCVVGSKTRTTAEAARRFGGSPEHVEAMAILVLQTNWAPGTVSHQQHAANLAAGLYSRRAITQAERVYEHGLLAFPSDPGVRVAYARFLSTFVQDPLRAIGMLQTVVKCQLRLEDRFALFSFGRSLDQKRQSSDLGESE